LLTAAFCRETLTALGNAALIESLTSTLDAKLSALEIGE
jgi:hypothetical protein